MSGAKKYLRFGLKPFLICLTLVGGGVGFVGRLWRTNPEAVLQAILWAPLVACVFCFGFAFLSASSRRHTVLWLVAATVSAYLGLVPANTLKSDQQRLRWLPSRHILTSRLTKLPDDRLAWTEIERRIHRNKISSELLDDYVSGLIQRHKDSKGRSEQITWPWLGSKTLTLAAVRDLLEEDTLVELADMRFGKPDVHALRIREGQSRIPLDVRYHAAISGVMLCPLGLKWDISDAWIGEHPVRTNATLLEPLSIELPADLEPGEHKLKINLHCGYHMYGRLSNGEFFPRRDWPAMMHKWDEQVVVPLTVYREDDAIVSTTSDPRLDPTKFIQFDRISPLKIYDGSTWRNTFLARVRLDTPHRLPCAMSFDMFLLFDGKRIPAGHFFAYRNETESDFQHHRSHLDVTQLQIAERADLEFVPNASHVEMQTNVQQIWGEEFLLRDVDCRVARSASEIHPGAFATER